MTCYNASAIASAMAPISTMKYVEVKGAKDGKLVKEIPVDGLKVDALTAEALGLQKSSNAPQEFDIDAKVKEMFPQGIDASKSGNYYVITYTTISASNNHVSSVKVIASKDKDGTEPLDAQE